MYVNLYSGLHLLVRWPGKKLTHQPSLGIELSLCVFSFSKVCISVDNRRQVPRSSAEASFNFVECDTLGCGQQTGGQ